MPITVRRLQTPRSAPVLSAPRIALALALAVGVWGLRSETATAQEGPGNFCVEDGPGGTANCTASDGGISYFRALSITDSCTNLTTDTGTATFRVELSTAGASRYDFGIFIDTSGASGRPALDGDSCYHDFLPGPLINTASPPGPPYLNHQGPPPDDDECGDSEPNQTWRRDTQSITFNCRDNDSDGRADLSLCTSWDNGHQDDCQSIADAFPDNPAKCHCGRFNLLGPLAVTVSDLHADVEGRRLGLSLMLAAAAAAVGLVLARRRQ